MCSSVGPRHKRIPVKRQTNTRQRAFAPELVNAVSVERSLALTAARSTRELRHPFTSHNASMKRRTITSHKARRGRLKPLATERDRASQKNVWTIRLIEYAIKAPDARWSTDFKDESPAQSRRMKDAVDLCHQPNGFLHHQIPSRYVVSTPHCMPCDSVQSPQKSLFRSGTRWWCHRLVLCTRHLHSHLRVERCGVRPASASRGAPSSPRASRLKKCSDSETMWTWRLISAHDHERRCCAISSSSHRAKLTLREKGFRTCGCVNRQIPFHRWQATKTTSNANNKHHCAPCPVEWCGDCVGCVVRYA